MISGSQALSQTRVLLAELELEISRCKTMDELVNLVERSAREKLYYFHATASSSKSDLTTTMDEELVAKILQSLKDNLKDDSLCRYAMFNARFQPCSTRFPAVQHAFSSHKAHVFQPCSALFRSCAGRILQPFP
ncbi:hypothetical protein PoB_006474000 [Plakobranchus ocellatus]|uniref:Uncharacterized protein n=1 Tax=Plakobranchus ocellatus TaxID=259542 RepID=A0AAV4D2N2_9GAST|nr:hypothetical protein PoB_006474000 [Plakobranchus ocellatus]